MTRDEAQALHRSAAERGRYLMWFVSTADPDHPGRAVAWAIIADVAGGTRQPGYLVAATIDELHAVLPAGLTRWERTPFMPADVVEAWE